MTMISVLYVDDEPDLLEIGKVFLEQIGSFTVDIVSSARDALGRLNSAIYDVIISDYQMSGMNGIEFLRKIRQDYDIPFILFTGRGREEVFETALESGVDYYVQKGGNIRTQFAELSHYIDTIVHHRYTEAELKREREFSRTLLKNLLIDSEDQYQVFHLSCPHSVSDPASQSQLSKSINQSSSIFYGTDSLPSEEPASPSTLLDDLVIGPEDQYRMEVLPSPSRMMSQLISPGSCHSRA